MDFGAFWKTDFYVVRDLDEGNLGTTYIREFFTNSTKHLNISNR